MQYMLSYYYTTDSQVTVNVNQYTYIEEFVKWAQMINWEVEEEGCLKYYRDYYHYFYFIIVKRKQDQ